MEKFRGGFLLDFLLLLILKKVCLEKIGNLGYFIDGFGWCASGFDGSASFDRLRGGHEGLLSILESFLGLFIRELKFEHALHQVG